MNKSIIMHDTACGPAGNFIAGQRYGVDGEHLTAKQAQAFVVGHHADYVDEKAEAKAAQKIETAEADSAPETAARGGKPAPRGGK